MDTVIYIYSTLISNSMCTCSFELRELEAKLKAGYMNKERAAQLAEKEAGKKREEVNNLFTRAFSTHFSVFLCTCARKTVR